MNADELLQSFCSTDELRPEITSPWRYKEYVGASDLWSLLLMPDIDSAYPETTIKVDSVLQQPFCHMQVPVANIRSAIDSLPLVPDTISTSKECPECSGDGVVTCYHCNQEMECEKCKGNGRISANIQTADMVPDTDAVIGLFKMAFISKMLRRLLAVADFYNVITITCVTDIGDNKIKPVQFKIGDAIVMLMPVFGEPVAKIDQEAK